MMAPFVLSFIFLARLSYSYSYSYSYSILLPFQNIPLIHLHQRYNSCCRNGSSPRWVYRHRSFPDIFLSNTDQRSLNTALIAVTCKLSRKFFIDLSPKSPKIYCKIVSGVFPTSNNVVIEWISPIFFPEQK